MQVESGFRVRLVLRGVGSVVKPLFIGFGSFLGVHFSVCACHPGIRTRA